MEQNAEAMRKEQLYKSVDHLTAENQRHFLNVLEALVFAQFEQNIRKIDEPLPPLPERGAGSAERIPVCTA